MNKPKVILSLIILILIGSTPLAHAETTILPLSSIVQIFSQQQDGDGFKNISGGSGVILENNGKIVTNAHVVLTDSFKAFDRYLICTTLNSSTPPACQYTGRLIAADADYDLAVLKITETDVDGKNVSPNFSPASWGSIDQVAIGSNLNIIGYPGVGGETITLTKGTVSGFIYNEHTSNAILRWLKTDAKLNPGNSGGGAFDDKGNLIGIPTAVRESNGADLGYIRPAPFVQQWLKSISTSTQDLSGKTPPQIVKEVPTDVENVRARPLDRSVELSWSPAFASDGIKQYEITYDEKAIDFSRYDENKKLPNYTTTSETKLLIKNLKNDTVYYFYVGSVSNKDYGSYYWSRPVKATPGLIAETPVTVFSDINSQHTHYLAISYLKEKGMVNGYSDNTFRSDQPVNRAELAKLLVTTKKETPDPSRYKNCFNDVHEEWFAMYVCFAKEKGWVAGYPDGSFLPSQTVNRVESLKMISNAYGLTALVGIDSGFQNLDAQAWYYPYVLAAEQFQLLTEKETIVPEQLMSRGQIAENMYRGILVIENGIIENSPVWRSPTEGLVNTEEYFPLSPGREWVYQRAIDNTNRNTTISVTGNCNDNPHCWKQESRIEFGNTNGIISNDEYISSPGIIHLQKTSVNTADTESVEYAYPSMTLTNRNRSVYFRYKEPIVIDDVETGGKITLLDGVTNIKLLGFETIHTPAGEKEGLRVSETNLVRTEIVFPTDLNLPSVTAILQQEQINTYVKGIGLVESTTRPGSISVNGKNQSLGEASSYKLISFR